MKNRYLDLLEELYIKHADPVKAIPMKKYMKDKFEYLGLSSIPRKEIYREFFKVNGMPEISEIDKLTMELWERPEREYQYFAMILLQKMEKKFNLGILPLYEYTITEKSWWDTVDFIAANLAGLLLKRNWDNIVEITGKWMASGNMWLQRTALLFQLKYKAGTDEKLLFSLIINLSEHKDFFIRKAIGWALREYSKTSPESVSEFVGRTSLSPLSEKEAMRIILK